MTTSIENNNLYYIDLYLGPPVLCDPVSMFPWKVLQDRFDFIIVHHFMLYL